MTKPSHNQADTELFGIAETTSNSPELIKFIGTSNPRYLRVIHALLVRSLPRKHVDHIAGCSNAPDLISRLRGLGLGKQGLLCTLTEGCDRDGNSIKYGVYSFSEQARRIVNFWLAKRAGDAI